MQTLNLESRVGKLLALLSVAMFAMLPGLWRSTPMAAEKQPGCESAESRQFDRTNCARRPRPNSVPDALM